MKYSISFWLGFNENLGISRPLFTSFIVFLIVTKVLSLYIDVYSLETDYMDVHGTNFEEIYEMKINNNEKENLLRKISYLSKVNDYHYINNLINLTK